MTERWSAGIVALALTACASSPRPVGPVTRAATRAATPAAVDEAARAYVELVCELSPETATVLGRHERDHDLDDRTPDGFARGLGREEAMLRDLHARFDGAALSPAARTDVRILMGALAADLAQKRATDPLRTRPSSYLDPLTAIFMMTAREYAPAGDRARGVLARLEKIPAVVAAAKANLTNPPRISTEIGIEMAGGAGAFFDEQRAPLVAALPGETARIERALAGAKAAYEGFATHLRDVVLPRSNGVFAAGAPLFDTLLRESYFLEDGHAAVLADGRRIYDATRAEMDRLAKKIDPAAPGWPAVVQRLKGNHPSADELLPSYRREVSRARAFLVAKDVVPFPEGDQCDVVETPAFQRATTTAAYDQPPPFDPSTKGLFFVTPPPTDATVADREAMLREHDHGDQVDTAVHEVYPGHHLQLSFARHNPSLVRKVLAPNISVEGWALYSEELMAELGYYTDEERMMQLAWTLVRAARVIIDVGLHTGGMPFEEAVRMLVDEVHLERPLALSEARRYTETPTQPLAYLIGREQIRALREKRRAAEGASFSLRRFHEEVLLRGAIPPALLGAELAAERGSLRQ